VAGASRSRAANDKEPKELSVSSVSATTAGSPPATNETRGSLSIRISKTDVALSGIGDRTAPQALSALFIPFAKGVTDPNASETGLASGTAITTADGDGSPFGESALRSAARDAMYKGNPGQIASIHSSSAPSSS
jgi:hypothetical protein